MTYRSIKRKQRGSACFLCATQEGRGEKRPGDCVMRAGRNISKINRDADAARPAEHFDGDGDVADTRRILYDDLTDIYGRPELAAKRLEEGAHRRVCPT